VDFKEEIIINSSSVSAHGCGGEHRGNPFHITWIPDMILLVTSRDFDTPLVEAFAKVAEYKPLARYREPTNGL